MHTSSVWEEYVPRPGYTRRDNNGGGVSYIGKFKDFLEKCVEEGNKDEAQKIKTSIPDTILYPTKHEVRCYVNQLVMNNKKKKGNR